VIIRWTGLCPPWKRREEDQHHPGLGEQTIGNGGPASLRWGDEKASPFEEEEQILGHR
jgi:hypothetical protein